MFLPLILYFGLELKLTKETKIPNFLRYTLNGLTFLQLCGLGVMWPLEQ